MPTRAPVAAALYTAIDRSPLPVAVSARELRFLQVNEAFATLHQMSADDPRGRLVTDVVPDLADAISAALRHVFATGQPLIDYEMAGARARHSHEVRHWSVNYLPVAGGDAVNRVIAMVCEST